MAQPRQPPELTTDIIGEIVLRLPPSNPACLVRASLVCKLWRGIISDHTFPGRYRKFHRIAPVLGFFGSFYTGSGFNPHFVPITAPSPFPQPESGSQIVDCRHGRVLLQDIGRGKFNFTVWDPITGHRQDLYNPGIPPNMSCAAAVLCGTDGCDHLGCHGIPFKVVFVCRDYKIGLTRACLYSSETGVCSAPAYVSRYYFGSFIKKRSVLIGDETYFVTGTNILKYYMGKHCLSTIDLPCNHGEDAVLMPVEDGSLLGLAYSRNSNIYLWSRKVNSDGVARWMQCSVIELEKLIPAIKSEARVVGSAEGLGAIFISSQDSGTFMIELKSGRVTKICQLSHFVVFPFLSFYTPDCASSKLQKRQINQR